MTLRASLLLALASLLVGVWLGVQPARDVDREVAVRVAECRADLADAQRGQREIRIEAADRLARCMQSRIDEGVACDKLLREVVGQQRGCAIFTQLGVTKGEPPWPTRRR